MARSYAIAWACSVWIGASLAGCERQPEPAGAAAPEPAASTGRVTEEVTVEHPTGHVPEPHDSDVAPTENQLRHDEAVPGVQFRVTSPRHDEVLESGERVEINFDLQGYRTGPELGQHVHVILDNAPYIAHYDANSALVLEDVPDGTHVLRAFPARHYHLALKEGDPFAVVKFHVGRQTPHAFDPDRPFITYSRPKGTYSREAARNLLLDFYVSNVELGEQAKVRYTVDGQARELTEWQPVILDPLSPGEHTVTLELLDGDGTLIENGGFNRTTRSITIE